MKKIYTVYVLYSPRYDKIYIGFSSDLTARMLAHNFLDKKAWTRNFRPWLLIYFEDFVDKPTALRRERTLKNGRNRKLIYQNFIRNKQYLNWLAEKRKEISLRKTPHPPHQHNSNQS